MNAKDAFFYVLNDPDPDFKAAEAEILKDCDPEWAYVYARTFAGDRWKAAESVIRMDPKWACLYAMWVGLRWRALEHAK